MSAENIEALKVVIGSAIWNVFFACLIFKFISTWFFPE